MPRLRHPTIGPATPPRPCGPLGPTRSMRRRHAARASAWQAARFCARWRPGSPSFSWRVPPGRRSVCHHHTLRHTPPPPPPPRAQLPSLLRAPIPHFLSDRGHCLTDTLFRAQSFAVLTTAVYIAAHVVIGQNLKLDVTLAGQTAPPLPPTERFFWPTAKDLWDYGLYFSAILQALALGGAQLQGGHGRWAAMDPPTCQPVQNPRTLSVHCFLHFGYPSACPKKSAFKKRPRLSRLCMFPSAPGPRVWRLALLERPGAALRLVPRCAQTPPRGLDHRCADADLSHMVLLRADRRAGG